MTFCRLFGLACAMRLVGIAFDMPLWYSMALMLGCIAMAIPVSSRIGAIIVAVVCMSGVVALSQGHQTMLMFWVAAALALFDREPLKLVLRVQVIVVYTVTTANKMFPDFLSGDLLGWALPWLPFPRFFASLAVFGLALTGLATVRRWPVAPFLAIGYHSAALLVANDLLHMIRLVGFGTIMVLLVLVAVGRIDVDRAIGQRDWGAVSVSSPSESPAW